MSRSTERSSDRSEAFVAAARRQQEVFRAVSAAALIARLIEVHFRGHPAAAAARRLIADAQLRALAEYEDARQSVARLAAPPLQVTRREAEAWLANWGYEDVARALKALEEGRRAGGRS